MSPNRLQPNFAMNLRMAFLCLLICGLITAAVGQEPKSTAAKPESSPAKTEPSESPSFGMIKGRVVSEDGPMPFVQVSATPVSTNQMRGRGNQFHTITTDAEGNFKLDGLQSTAWNLFAQAQGYVTEPATEEDSKSFYRIGESATIRLTKGGVITGRVLNAGGEPVVALQVSAQFVRDPQGRTTGSNTGVGFFQTDDRGVYRIYGLQPGNYIVSAGRSSGGGFGGGARFNPYDGEVPTYFPSATRDTAIEVSVNSGTETGGIDIQYRGERGHAISGKIVDPTNTNQSQQRGGFGGPGGGISVTLTHASTGNIINRSFVMSRNGNNVYSLYGIPDGEYEVTAERNSPGENDASSQPRKVLVNGRDVTGIDLSLLPMASITAKITLENELKETKCEIKRKGNFTEQVFELNSENGSNDFRRPGGRMFGGSNRLSPEKNGEMNFRSLSQGHYWLESKLLDENWYIRAITAPGIAVKSAAAKASAKPTTLDVARHGLNLKSGEKLVGLTVRVSEGAATLKGKIKSANGAALPMALSIYLIPTERERAEDLLRYATATVANDGSYRFGNLAPGKYWLLPIVEMDDAHKKIRNIAERTKLKQAAEALNTVVELQPCQNLAGFEVQYKTK